jgi:hydrogenase nickel incorporation protein HypA/HybF
MPSAKFRKEKTPKQCRSFPPTLSVFAMTPGNRLMHEMALTASLVELIEIESQKQSFSRVLVVHLDIGALGGVDPEAIRFCFEASARRGILDSARLEIRIIPGKGWCVDCAKPVEVFDRFDACPECGGCNVRATGGDDIRIRDLEVE